MQNSSWGPKLRHDKTAFQEEAIRHTEVFYRFRFREGCTSAKCDKHSGHPSMSSKMK